MFFSTINNADISGKTFKLFIMLSMMKVDVVVRTSAGSRLFYTGSISSNVITQLLFNADKRNVLTVT